ncbi:MAG: glycosyltransferase [Candidatus Magasanikbacteria bacterium]|jgi:UDP-N-acetylglucosamine--N-acetylmuramyl-(pentapeptide) pyrophosphoryl-undecaprenol N-acetylglucosamine transferase
MSSLKIVLSGGGTLGPVTPLLAVREAVLSRFPDADFVWVGTADGPEKALVEELNIPYYIMGAGKWRRYFSFLNLIDLLKIFYAFIQSLIFLWQEKPQALISAGGFVSVPLHGAGWILGIPSWVHQQDVVPGLANKLMAPLAKQVTVALEQSLKYFSRKKTIWLGNPARQLSGITQAEGKNFFGFKFGAPVVFVVGGGTGSARLNQIMIEALPAWPKDWQIIHLVGRDRPRETASKASEVFDNYHVFDFFTKEMRYAYAAADVVVARAGFNTITELALLSKAAILSPAPGHQEANADFLKKHDAAWTLNQSQDGGLKLVQMVKELILIPQRGRVLGENIHRILPIADPKAIAVIVDRLIK